MDRHSAEPRVEALPGERASRWVAYQRRHAAPSTAAYEFVWDRTADAVGPFCTDVDGNVLLDFTSHIASAPLGYNNPTVREKLAAYDLATPTKTAGQVFYAGGGWPPESADLPGPAQLMDRLTDLTGHYGLDTVFLSNTGAEAVENAMKICYDHTGGASQAVTFRSAFHGRTLGALSLNRSKPVHRRDFPELPGVHDVPFCADRACDPASCDCGFFPDGDASLLRRTIGPQGYVDPADLAFVAVEPIQGEGGYRFPSDAFARELQAVCDEYDVLLVADEIQTGLGRTGEWWGADHYAIEPDVVASAKAAQVGATIASRDVFPEERGRISSTWGGGDHLAALQAVVTIETIEEEDLLANATARGEQLKRRLREADPAAVSDVRGRGLMVALDLPTKEILDQTVRAAFERGLLTLGCGQRTLRLIPPLDVTEREVDLAVDVLLEAIADTASKADLPSDVTETI